MVNHSRASLDNIFSALSDPTRRAIIAQLATGEQSVTEIAEPFEMSLPAISKHLRVLEKAGLLHRRKEGRVHHLSLISDPMQSASQWLDTYRIFWEDSFDTLAKLIEDEEKTE